MRVNAAGRVSCWPMPRRTRTTVAIGAAIAALAVLAVWGVVHFRRQRSLAAACHREADARAAERRYAETTYGIDAFLVERGQILMRDAEGRIERVNEDVFARQLGQGWRPADAEQVRAADIEACMRR